MIYYTSGLPNLICNVMRMSGSVFPTCFCIALPPALIALALHWYMEHEFINFVIPPNIMSQSQAWSGFTSLVGFLIVFRTSQAYSRWWEGCSATFRMRAEFLDAASAVIAFCKASKAPAGEVAKFKHIFVRLMSLLHASALAEVEEVTDSFGMPDQRYDLLDPEGLCEETLIALRDADCKVELLFTWVQQLLLEFMNSGVLNVPPPILSRVFQELAQGMVQFQNAVKLSSIPFPFVYAQACDFLLVFHWIVSPIVTAQWVSTPYWAAALSFIQVFTLWALNTIATGIENPFGSDAMDLDGSRMQSEMNAWLRMFLLPAVSITPTLTPERVEEILQDPNIAENVERTSMRLSVSRHFHTLLAQGSTSSCAPSSIGTRVSRVASDGFYQSESSESDTPEKETVVDQPMVDEASDRSSNNDWKAAIRQAQQDLSQMDTSLETAFKGESLSMSGPVSNGIRRGQSGSSIRSASSASLGTNSTPLVMLGNGEEGRRTPSPQSPHGFGCVVEECVWETQDFPTRSMTNAGSSSNMGHITSETSPRPARVSSLSPGQED